MSIIVLFSVTFTLHYITLQVSASETTGDYAVTEPVVVLTTPPPPPRRLTVVTDQSEVFQVTTMCTRIHTYMHLHLHLGVRVMCSPVLPNTFTNIANTLLLPSTTSGEL